MPTHGDEVHEAGVTYLTEELLNATAGGTVTVVSPASGISATAPFRVRPYRGGKGRSLPVRGRGNLVVRGPEVSATLIYDPPGSGWISLGLAVITAVVVVLVAQATGVAAGPGWIIWYFIVRAWRKQVVTLELQAEYIKEAVFDPEEGRLAFITSLGWNATSVNSLVGWVGMALSGAPSDMLLPLSVAWGAKLRVGKVKRRDRVLLFVALGLFLLLIASAMTAYLASR